jgi:hypothetical protein
MQCKTGHSESAAFPGYSLRRRTVTPRDACDESPELVATDAVTVRASAEFVRLRLVAPHTLSVLGAAGVPERPSAERSARLIALQKYRSYAVQYGAADQAT